MAPSYSLCSVTSPIFSIISTVISASSRNSLCRHSSIVSWISTQPPSVVKYSSGFPLSVLSLYISKIPSSCITMARAVILGFCMVVACSMVGLLILMDVKLSHCWLDPLYKIFSCFSSIWISLLSCIVIQMSSQSFWSSAIFNEVGSTTRDDFDVIF